MRDNKLREQSMLKHQFERSLEEEKIAADMLEQSLANVNDQQIDNANGNSNTICGNIYDSIELDSSTREKCCKNGVWLKWIVERLKTEEEREKYNDVKDRIHNKHGLTQVSESLILRFLFGLEFDVDLVETKIVHHIKFMTDNNLWEIDDSRIPNIINEHILIVYKEDIYERPINYARIGRFFPNDFEFEEIRTYCFWNYQNAMKAYKPHVQSTITVYDLKGLSKKNLNVALFKKLGPELEDNLPELSPCIYLIRQSFIVSFVWKVVRPFMQKSTANKFRFLSDKEMSTELLKLIPAENLPSIYGGSDTEFEILYP